MVRTQIQITEEQHRRLKAEAYRRAMSVSAVVREALAEKLGSTGPEGRRAEVESAWLALIGCGHDEATDVAENHDKYLAEIYDEGNG